MFMSQSFPGLVLTSLSVSIDGSLQTMPTYISKCFLWHTDNLYWLSVSL